MIKVFRIDEPDVLVKNKVEWLATYIRLRGQWEDDPTDKDKKKKAKAAEAKYNEPSVKEALRIMFHDKCAYCESTISHVSYGNIEHFKPKSLFPEFCFEWENLLLGCEICNSKKFKGIKFPGDTEGGPLINPVIDDPDVHFRFEYDPKTGTANVIGTDSRGEITETILGLNRPDLVRHRSRIVRRMMVLFIDAKRGSIEALEEVEKLMRSEEEYSAFAKVMYATFGLAKAN